MTPVTIQTPRLILREFLPSDADALQQQANDPLVQNFSSRVQYPFTMEHARKWLEHIELQKAGGYTSELPLAITKEGSLAGMISFIRIQPHHMAIIGYWIGAAFRRQGLTSEAVSHFCDYGFGQLQLRRIYTYVANSNSISPRVLEKNGFLLEGTLRKNLFVNGEYKDHLLYAKVV